MSLSAKQSNGIDVRIEGVGPHIFGAEDYRGWIEGQIRQAVKAVLEEILEAEMATHLGAAPGERTESRRGYRNGSYTRERMTRVGEVELSVPRDREGTFRPGVFERYRRLESPLEEALLVAYLEGVRTRRVGDLAQALAGQGLSAASVSRLNGRLSERLAAWRERPLSGAYAYLSLDGISLAVRWGGASERVSVLVALGVNPEGYREVLACLGRLSRERGEVARTAAQPERARTHGGAPGHQRRRGRAEGGDGGLPARRSLVALHGARHEERIGQGAADEARGGGGGAENDLAPGERGRSPAQGPARSSTGGACRRRCARWTRRWRTAWRSTASRGSTGRGCGPTTRWSG